MAMSQAEIKRIEDSLFFEPPEMRARLIRFFMLILFSSVIASSGLLSDSVASIIGAMIISPLMVPIMGIVVAMILGSRGRFTRSLTLVITGVALAIAIGWVIATVMPFGWNPLESEQIMARTSPRLLDLVIALASGGAGAYALSRSDITDALPGVAISISLVPPLNTVGIMIAAGDGEEASGAMLLFVTNFAAILFMGTITFVATGLATGVGRSGRDLRLALIAAAVVVVIVAIPLVQNSDDLWHDTNKEDDAYELVSDWLAPSSYVLERVVVDDEHVTIHIAGEGDLPPNEELLADLRDVVGDDMVLTAEIFAARVVNIGG